MAIDHAARHGRDPRHVGLVASVRGPTARGGGERDEDRYKPFGSPWAEELCALGRAHYKRYDESTATALGDGAELMRTEYRDDLRRLRARAERIRREELERAPGRLGTLSPSRRRSGQAGTDRNGAAGPRTGRAWPPGPARR